MIERLGIRREDKNEFERRVPLVPADVAKLIERGIQVFVQPSKIRIFSDDEFVAVGAILQEDLSNCQAIVGVKEVPVNLIIPGMAYIMFAHVIKGQPGGMPRLRKMMDAGCSLFDFELLEGVSPGWSRFVGISGVAETLCALGRRLEWEGMNSSFKSIRQTYRYGSVDELFVSLAEAGRDIADNGLPQGLAPLIVGIYGDGHCSRGVQEALEILPCERINPSEIGAVANSRGDSDKIFMAVFQESDMFVRNDGGEFDLQEYYDKPELYHSVTAETLPYLTVAFNVIRYFPQYPRLVTKENLRKLFSGNGVARLRVIGDISCDSNGAIECTDRGTSPDNPVYVYSPETGETPDGVAGEGVVIMSVDHLPAELPRESSEGFSKKLLEVSRFFMEMEFSPKLNPDNFSEFSRRPMILCNGDLQQPFEYLKKSLPGN